MIQRNRNNQVSLLPIFEHLFQSAQHPMNKHMNKAYVWIRNLFRLEMYCNFFLVSDFIITFFLFLYNSLTKTVCFPYSLGYRLTFVFITVYYQFAYFVRGRKLILYAVIIYTYILHRLLIMDFPKYCIISYYFNNFFKSI